MAVRVKQGGEGESGGRRREERRRGREGEDEKQGMMMMMRMMSTRTARRGYGHDLRRDTMSVVETIV